MANLESTIMKFLLVGGLVISLFSFIIIVQQNNDAPKRLADNQIFNGSFNELSSQLSNSSTGAQTSYNSFNSEEPTPSSFSIVLFSIVAVGKSFSSMIFGIFLAIIKLPLIVLGIPATIYSLIITVLVIVVIIGVWLVYKIGG